MQDLEFLLPGEVAKTLRVSDKTIYKMADRSEIPHLRIGKRTLRIPKREFDKWILRNLSKKPKIIGR